MMDDGWWMMDEFFQKTPFDITKSYIINIIY